MKETNHSRILAITAILSTFFSLVGCENRELQEKRIQAEEKEKVLQEELKALNKSLSRISTIYKRSIEEWPEQKSSTEKRKKQRTLEKEYEKAKRKLDLYKQEIKTLCNDYPDFYYTTNWKPSKVGYNYHLKSEYEYNKELEGIHNWRRSFILKMNKLDEELLSEK